MVRLYKRKAQIVISKLGEGSDVILENIRIFFDIEMNDDKSMNTGKIDIYNLSEETLGLLEKKDISITLKIGYDNEELSTLFIGNVVEYENDFEGADVITRITLKDGYIPLTNKKLSLSFAENSNTKQIIEKIIAELNLTKSDYSSLPNYVYTQGFSFIGSPGAALNIVLSRIGYEWVIINNALIISKHNESNKQIFTQYISPETGLIDRPKRFKQKQTRTKTQSNKLIDGWKIRSLIIPSIQPKNLIKVKSSEIEGDFLIKSVRFNGDTDDNNWFCDIQAIQKYDK